MFVVIIVLLVLLQAITVHGSTERVNNCKIFSSGKMEWHCMSCYDRTYLIRQGREELYNECRKCMERCSFCTYNKCYQCYPGRYGEICQFDCSDGCKNATCEKLSGSCTCKEHFTGETCAECATGRYGLNCTLQQCNIGCLNNTCDKTTGECSCKDGFSGLKCSQCIPGQYGSSCQLKCSNGCKDGTCDRETGQCSCKTNYSGEKCHKCTNGHYGTDSNCTLQCPTNCVSCKSDRKCSICKPGYYGLDCQLSCHPGCLLGNCSRVGGYCQNSACKPGYEGDRCNYCNATGKPGMDCNLLCMKHCLRCLTNVTCEECMVGFWGSDCTNHCPKICKGIACNKYNGSCWRFGLCTLLNKYKIEFSMCSLM